MIWSNNDGMWEAQDLGARAGILVNGEPVAQRVLAAGDRIQVGDTILSVESIRHLSAQQQRHS
jgi:pSer/pThr/pTyr-binding forkhead associated (FHA) protein